MANSTVAEISTAVAAITGLLRWSPSLATALPTNSTTALASAYVNLGYVGEDGVAPAREISLDPVRDSNGAKLLDIQTEFSKTYTATLLQVRNPDLNKAIFGASNVTTTAADATFGNRLAVIDVGLLSTPGILVLDSRYGAGRHRRVMPYVQITSVEEAALVGRSVRSFAITFSLSPDPATGAYDFLYDDDGLISA